MRRVRAIQEVAVAAKTFAEDTPGARINVATAPNHVGTSKFYFGPAYGAFAIHVLKNGKNFHIFSTPNCVRCMLCPRLVEHTLFPCTHTHTQT